MKDTAAKLAAEALRSPVVKHGIEEALRFIPPAVGKFTKIFADRGQGSYVWDTDGHKYLDMTTGIGATSTGHCHPRVSAAIAEQANTFIHAQQNCLGMHKPMQGLMERLDAITPPHLDNFFWANSGSEAVDNAVKIARAATKRQHVISFEGGFHGRTIGAMALTASKTSYRLGFSPLMPGVFVAPYPYCLHCKVREAKDHNTGDSGFGYPLAPTTLGLGEYNDRWCCGKTLDSLEWMLKQQTSPQETAAIIVEPIQGEGGFIVPPPQFLKSVRDICNQHGILMILDEVQAGVGRTGKWWGHEHFGVQPDILIFAKGIASGFPIAGLACTSTQVAHLPAGTLGGTYGGNAIGCAAANATLDVIKDENLLENTNARGQQLMRGLVELSKDFPIIDVRGRGLMVAAEFSFRPGCAAELCKAAQDRGMLLLTAGSREAVRFLPALNVSEGEIDECLSILRASMEEVFNLGHPAPHKSA